MKSIWRVSQYVFKYRGLFILYLSLALGSTLFLISVPQIIRVIFDDIIEPRRSDLLIWGVAAVAVAYFFRDLLNCLRIRINNILEQRVLVDLRRDLHSKLLELPIGYYDKRKSGEIASRVIEDVQSVERVIIDGTEQGTVALLTVFGITTILFLEQPLLASFIIIPLPIVLWLSLLHFKATRRNWKRVRESAGALNSLLIEDIQGNSLISSFALKKRESGRFIKLAKELHDHTLHAMFRWSVHGPGSNFIASLGTVAVIGIGGSYLMQAEPNATNPFTFGDFVAIFAYCALLYQPISTLNSLNHLLAAGRASSERVFEILDHPVHIKNPEEPQSFPSGLVSVSYQNVSFRYPDRDEVIQGLNLELPPGKVTAIVGHTGAGKSTMANLLLRYYDVTGGCLTINGIDVRQLDLDGLRQHIGFVAQDPFLFDGTVEENLRLAKEEATEAEILTALDAACSLDFVNELPQGLNTMIGERGIRLSMGEKQRLTIARVILKNPPFVILDEATSSVDTLTESRIQQAVDNLVQSRTTLVIAHRLSTVSRADQIIVLEKGNIIEQGTHLGLLQTGGHYAQLWKAQTDLIPEEV